MDGVQSEIYFDCITKQLEEMNLLSSIYCTLGEMHIYDPGVISDLNEFIQRKPTNRNNSYLASHLDFSIKLNIMCAKSIEKIDVRIELPHLYPLLLKPIVIVHSNHLTKFKEEYIKKELDKYMDSMEKDECYIYQVLSWLQEKIEDALNCDIDEMKTGLTEEIDDNQSIEFERLWIYSHHIKSKTKRQEIIKEAKNLDMSGFSRPGKPGVICVEGLKRDTQTFWRIIKSMQWQKIKICKSETENIMHGELNQKRRFNGFKEQVFCDDNTCENIDSKDTVMNMSLFIKYLEAHQSSYMKKELFGFD